MSLIENANRQMHATTHSNKIVPSCLDPLFRQSGAVLLSSFSVLKFSRWTNGNLTNKVSNLSWKSWWTFQAWFVTLRLANHRKNFSRPSTLLSRFLGYSRSFYSCSILPVTNICMTIYKYVTVLVKFLWMF